MKNENQDIKDYIPLMKIDNLRINTDGGGIRSLLLAAYCPLHCRYCINNFCHEYPEEKIKQYTIDELFQQISPYILYYQASNGGITFGGGEPLLYSDYILSFCQKYGDKIEVMVETSLNTVIPRLEELAGYVKTFYVDIKDMNPQIYQEYTGIDQKSLLQNLKILQRFKDRVVIRIPYISKYNTWEDMEKSKKKLTEMGYEKFNLFRYIRKI